MKSHITTIKRPLGQLTRGKTARNRLRRVDNFVMLYDPFLLNRRDDGLFVDVGYGAEPTTTLESAARFRRLNPSLKVVGVEIDRARVDRARPFVDDRTDFRLGGFNLPLRSPETARVIRAFNVLRQYDESAVADAHATLGHYLQPGGLLIEGTSDPFGRVWVANLLRKTETALVPEGLVFSINLRAGFDPEWFQPVLPKNFIHRVVPGEPIACFLDDWKLAYRQSLPLQVWGAKQVFADSIYRLAAQGYRVNTRRRCVTKGYLVLNEVV